MLETDYKKIVNSILFDNNDRHKLFIYFKDDNSKDDYAILINCLSERFGKVIDFYDIRDYIGKICFLTDIMIMKDDKNNIVLTSETVDKTIIEEYFTTKF